MVEFKDLTGPLPVTQEDAQVEGIAGKHIGVLHTQIKHGNPKGRKGAAERHGGRALHDDQIGIHGGNLLRAGIGGKSDFPVEPGIQKGQESF